MATVKINPVSAKSRGGYSVTITGIDPTDQDCLSGSIVMPGEGLKVSHWNLNGLMRDGNDKTNLNMQTNDLPDLAKLARKLGAV